MSLKPLSDKRNLIIVVSALIIASGLMFVRSKQSESSQMQMPPAQVTAIKLEKQNIDLQFKYFGKTSGSLEVDVKARVNGILKNKTFVEGQFVKKGDSLFNIESDSYENDLAIAKAQLKSQEANLTQATVEWERISGLYKSKISSGHDKDKSYAEYLKAKAAVDKAKSEVSSAQLQLDYTNITAPIDGMTGKETMSVGSMLGTQMGYVKLTSIVQLNPLFINFSFSDTDKSYIQKLLSNGSLSLPDDKKMRATITTESGKEMPNEAIIDFMDNLVSVDSATVSARAVLSNADHALLPGEFVNVQLKGATLTDAIVIPEQSIMHGPLGTFVYALDAESKAIIKPIVLGPRFIQGQIVESGLQAGDNIVVEGMIKVGRGAVVENTFKAESNIKVNKE